MGPAALGPGEDAMKRFLAATVLGLFAISAMADAQEEQWLQYRSSREPWRFGINLTSRQLEYVNEAPKELEHGEVVSSEARFAAWQTPMAPSGSVWMLIDSSQPGEAPDTIYIDSNADGSLADEKPVTAHSSTREFSQFGPLRVVFQGEDGPVTCHVNIASYNHKEYKNVQLTSGGWYEGPVTVAGKRYNCRLVDFNSNGTYDDTSMDFNELDHIYLGESTAYDRHFAGKYIRIGGALYHPRPARDGAFVVFEPALDVPTGKLALPETTTMLSLGGEGGLLSFEVEGGSVEAPVGTWLVSEWTSTKKDARGATWTMTGAGFASKGAFAVKKGAAVELALGEPVTAKLTAAKSGSSWAFTETLHGQLGEKISLLVNGQRPPAPRLRIENEDSSYSRLYTFEYG